MPEGLDELMLAGFLRRERVELVKCVTVDLEVPANAQIILEGYVEPGERRREGPFGDHTGFYSHPDDYPVFHVTCITQRRRPLYLTTVVGIPPMEDYYLGKASERIFLPLIRKTLPEIVDMAFPAAGIFHNIVLVSIDKRYPGHARKIMNAFWGLGQLMFSKTIIVVDKDVNVQNEAEVAWIVGTHYDPERDIQFTRGPVDDLEDASDLPALGSKMGIDATRKWASEGFKRTWPTRIVTTPEAGRKAEEDLAEDREGMESMMAGSLPIEALAERVASGGEILETDAQLLLDTPDLIAVGAIADDVRRGCTGRRRPSFASSRFMWTRLPRPCRHAPLLARSASSESRRHSKWQSRQSMPPSRWALPRQSQVFRLPICRPWTVVLFPISAHGFTTQGSSLLPTCQSICCRIRSQPLARPELPV